MVQAREGQRQREVTEEQSDICLISQVLSQLCPGSRLLWNSAVPMLPRGQARI